MISGTSRPTVRRFKPTPVMSQLAILLAPIAGDCSGEVTPLSDTSATGEMGWCFDDGPLPKILAILGKVPVLGGEDVKGMPSLALRLCRESARGLE